MTWLDLRMRRNREKIFEKKKLKATFFVPKIRRKSNMNKIFGFLRAVDKLNMMINGNKCNDEDLCHLVKDNYNHFNT